MLDRLIVVIGARRALAADDDADVDESSVSDVAVLEPPGDRARVAEGRRTELLDILRPVEAGDDHESCEEVFVAAHVGQASVQLARHASSCSGSGHASPS